MKFQPLIFLVSVLLMTRQVQAQQTIPLYKDAIPNSTPYKMKELPITYNKMVVGASHIDQPTLSIFLPDTKTANGTAVIICPGGGYAVEMLQPEGKAIAETWAKHGVTAFVLKYRLPSDSIMPDKSIGPLQDAQQAIKLVRSQAKTWNLNPSKIGIMGFSAGGHLAATAATHFDTAYVANQEGTSLRPDFAILIYPVISLTDELAHKGSRDLLLGKNPTQQQITRFSNDQRITPQTPPTWLTHAGDDQTVVVANSIRFYEALLRNKVPAEMHLYPKGGHGFVLYQPIEDWMQPLFGWMTKNGWMK